MQNSQLAATSISVAFDARRRRLAIAATIGNLLEWYDFFIFGVLAITMAKLFFPAENELTSLLLSLATYGGGLAMRPVGAILLGLYADRVGRKAALCLAMVVMGLSTALIAVTPTYETIGVAAPLLIVLARLLQGFSASGELGSATALLVESAPDRWRGLYASLNAVSAQLGFVLAAFVTLVITLILTPAQIEAGGWRLPFFLGSAIVPAAIYIRSKLQEPDVFLQSRNEPTKPKATNVIREARPLLIAIGIFMLYIVAGNVLFVYMPTFAVRELGLPASRGLLATVVATCAMIVCTPLVAALSDRFGRKPILMLATVGYLLVTYPAFAIVTSWPSMATLMIVQTGLGMLNAVYIGPLMSAIAELFSTRVRATSVALAYSLTVMIGALSPAFATWLIAITGDARAAAFTVIAAAIISGLTLLSFRDRFREPLSS